MQVAKILNVSLSTVLRRFSNEPGVVDLGLETERGRRPYRLLRIPRGVLRRMLYEHRVREGGSARIFRRIVARVVSGS